MKPDPVFHQTREMTPAEIKEHNRKYTRKDKKRKPYRKSKKDINVYQGGNTGLRRQKKRR